MSPRNASMKNWAKSRGGFPASAARRMITSSMSVKFCTKKTRFPRNSRYRRATSNAIRACMAEVAEVVRGGAADVHLHDARGEGHEGVLPPRARVVQSKRHDGCERGHRARSIKALARGRRPSLLRDTIRLIRRNLYAAPRCARRRGPIDQRKIAAFARRKPWVQIPLGPLRPGRIDGRVASSCPRN